MYKIIVIPKNKEMINIECDAILLGIKNYSVNLPFYIDIDELEQITKNIKSEIFISLNKNIHDSEIETLKDILLKLNNYNIKGVFFYDISILNLKKKLNLNYDLVWNQEHFTTNYETINYWFKNGAKYTCLSSEITIKEVIEITNKTSSKLIMPIFGYIPIMNSRRHLIDNYLKEFDLNKKNGINYIEKEGKTYPIIDDGLGTTVYTNAPLNGIRDVLSINTEYVLLNSFLIDEDNFKKILNMFKTVTVENCEEYYNTINSIFNSDTYFLHKETIYKVK
ncbi:MAG: U32 family peptidase [Clostridium sp.]|nr:U32 family peptidase [Clostridium sp.]MCM1444131.1 U32 family peptidase [Candidatus Amulumruptor caecigallinarius]